MKLSCKDISSDSVSDIDDMGEKRTQFIVEAQTLLKGEF